MKRAAPTLSSIALIGPLAIDTGTLVVSVLPNRSLMFLSRVS